VKRAPAGTIVVLIVASFAIAQSAFKLTPPDKSFEATFPGKPTHEQNLSDSGPIHMEQNAYTFRTAEGKFVLSYLHLTPSPVDLKASDAIDAAISGTLGNVGGKLLTEGSLTMKGKPAKDVTIGVGENTIIDGRFVYVKPRVYQLIVLHRKGVIPAFQQEFFDSFSVN
jgi:hypothetical protein